MVDRDRTLIFTEADVSALLDDDVCIEAVESAFRLHGEGRSLAPAILAVAGRQGGFHVKAAGLEIDGRLYFASKTNGNFPGNPDRCGLPTIQGVIVLCDAENGYPLAIMGSGTVTSRRTAAATAVAARHLARRDATEATVIGCGEQGYAQLRALVQVLPLARVHLVDVSEERARALARRCATELGLEAGAAAEAAEGLRTSQVCVTCTTSKQPIVWRDQVQPGTFVAGVGADHPHKHELDPRLLAASRVVVDLLESCASSGDLHHALDAGVMRREDVHAELADVVSGRKAGRTSEDEITIFDSTGTALQDVAAAVVVYRRGLAARCGQEVDFAARSPLSDSPGMAK
jgi:alanine dehydrogenase